MPLDPDTLQRHMPLETRHDLTWQQTVLYALGAGVGLEDATGPEAMRLAYETDLAALPSMASILAYPGFWQKQERFGLTWQKILHGEQSVRIHRTLPVEGRLRGVTTIDGIFDKGAEKGALVYSRRAIFAATHRDAYSGGTVRAAPRHRAPSSFARRAGLRRARVRVRFPPPFVLLTLCGPLLCGGWSCRVRCACTTLTPTAGSA